MTDTIVKIVHDTLIKNVVLKPDSIFNSNLDILGKVDSFYSNSISLVVTLIAVIAPIAIGLVSFAAVWIQKRNYKLERESINKDIEKVTTIIENVNVTLNSKIDNRVNNLLKLIADNAVKVIDDQVILTKYAEALIHYESKNFKKCFDLMNEMLFFLNGAMFNHILVKVIFDLLDKCLTEGSKDISRVTAKELINNLKVLETKWMNTVTYSTSSNKIFDSIKTSCSILNEVLEKEPASPMEQMM